MSTSMTPRLFQVERHPVRTTTGNYGLFVVFVMNYLLKHELLQFAKIKSFKD